MNRKENITLSLTLTSNEDGKKLEACRFSASCSATTLHAEVIFWDGSFHFGLFRVQTFFHSVQSAAVFKK